MPVTSGDADRFLVRFQRLSFYRSLPASGLTLRRLIAGGLAALVLRFRRNDELD